jgi:hypothetical protein
MTKEYLERYWDGHRWTEWVPFEDGDFTKILNEPGLYRVKSIRGNRLFYIGQTSSLRTRLQCLAKGTLADKMPWNDPHTAAPRLWSWKDAKDTKFECSATLAEDNLTKRQLIALEHQLIWKYRLETGESPVCNFGRCHAGYKMPGNRNTRRRGRPMQIQANKNSRVGPLLPKSKPIEQDWMGLVWMQYQDSNRVFGPGLYKIIHRKRNEIVYIGQSATLEDRITTHMRRYPQSQFAIHFVIRPADTPKPVLLEIENDLLAAFCRQFGKLPVCQLNRRTSGVQT